MATRQLRRTHRAINEQLMAFIFIDRQI